MSTEDHDPLQLAYDEGFNDARRRDESEIDYLKGRIMGLEKANEQILKAMSDAMYRLPMPPTLVKLADKEFDHIDGNALNNDPSNLRLVDKPR